MKVFDRKNSSYYEENVEAGSLLNFLYNNKFGNFLLEKIFVSKGWSDFAGKIYSSKLSKFKIGKFIKKYEIDMEQFEQTNFNSFNDFFIRRLRSPELRKFPENECELGAVADSKLRVFEITKNGTVFIKGHLYTFEDLVGDASLAKEFENGVCLVFRLTPDDYHRYNFFDNGTVLNKKSIAGKYHTVNSYSDKSYSVYSENNREYSIIETKNFGKVMMMEVGALMVGKINNFEKNVLFRGEEKGYFSFGGSTIVVFFQQNKVNIDTDILLRSYDGIETKVLMGEKIGVCANAR